MSEFKIMDLVVKETGDKDIFIVDFQRQSGSVVIRKHGDKYKFNRYCKPYCKIRHATPKEIKQGFRDE